MEKYSRQSNKAFTLIELLVVVAIIGILSGVVLASLKTARLKARNTQRISNLTEIRKALEMYYADYGVYPSTSGGWETECAEFLPQAVDSNIIPNLAPNYISKVPQDPSFVKTSTVMSNCYYYRSNGTDYAFLNIYVNDAGFSSSSYPVFIDPVRGSGWKIYSSGGRNW